MEILNHHHFLEKFDDNEKLYTKMYNEYLEKSHSTNKHDLKTEASHQHFQDEKNQTTKVVGERIGRRTNEVIRIEKKITEEFGKCLWEKSLERQRGKGTTEDLYWWYKKQVNMGQTPSEIFHKFG